MRSSVISLIAIFCLAASPLVAAEAKDIKLGGEKKGAELPPNTTQLKPIAVAIRTEDGGWRHIRIDAWLESKDPLTAKAMEAAKSVIIAKADRDLPNRNFDTLLSPELGSNEAKKAIRSAVEASLGHPWNGEVLIHNFVIY